MTESASALLTEVRFDKYPDQLVPVVVQHAETGAVLTLAYADKEALRLSLASGEAHFFSRSRQQLWRKGETSGNILKIIEIVSDCDRDALLYFVLPTGPACHTGTESCFDNSERDLASVAWLVRLDSLIATRQAANAPDSYVAGLFREGLDRIIQKVGEEAVETVIAAKNSDTKSFTGEAADLVFHLLVLLRAKGLRLADVCAELRARHQGR